MLGENPHTPARYERGAETRAEMAARLGVSQRHLRRLLARERAEATDDGEPIYVALTDDPAREGGEYYDLRSDHCSVERGPIRIGTYDGRKLKVRSLGGGRHAEPSGPTKYDPPDDGLKGGVDP